MYIPTHMESIYVTYTCTHTRGTYFRKEDFERGYLSSHCTLPALSLTASQNKKVLPRIIPGVSTQRNFGMHRPT